MDINELTQLSRARALCSSGAARRIRIGARLSIGELSSTAVVSPAAVSRWERNLRAPSGDAGLRYARILDTLLNGGAS